MLKVNNYCCLFPNQDETAAVVDDSGFFGGSSTTTAARFIGLRRREEGFDAAGGGAGSSPVTESRCPSKTAVSQFRLFSVSTAQILAAAPASFNGPATSRNCMPGPLLASLITMIGRSAVSGAFDRDFDSPRHSARRPATELAVPRSTPNWVRWTATFGAVSSSASASLTGAEATTSGIGLAVTGLTGLAG